MSQYTTIDDQHPSGRWAKATGLGDGVLRWPDTKYSQEAYWQEIWFTFFSTFIYYIDDLVVSEYFNTLKFTFDRRLWESDGKIENAISRVWDSVAARLRTNIGIPLWVLPGSRPKTPPRTWKIGK